MNTFKLKNILSAVMLTVAINSVYAQDLPDSFNYQAVVNKEDGTPVASKDITVEVSVIQGTDCETNNCTDILWQELHYTQTNDFGLFNVEIGSKSAKSTGRGSVANYSDIDWIKPTGSYYLRVRVDFGEAAYINGFTDLGTSKFAAVPYALVALTTDQANRLKLTDGKIVHKLSELADVNVDNAEDGQVLTLNGGVWTAKSVSTSDGGVAKLSDIGDVVVSPQNGDCLVYDNGNWVASDGGATKLSELKDVSPAVENANTGVVLYKTTSGWAAKSFNLDDYTDAQKDQVLTYNGKSWVAKDAAKVEVTVPYIVKGNVSETNKGVGKVLALSSISDPLKWEFKEVSTPLWEPSGTKSGFLVPVGDKINGVITNGGLILGNTKDATGTALGSAIAFDNGVAYSGCIAGVNATIGGNTYVNSIAFGEKCNVNGKNTFAFGAGCVASSGQTVVGHWNKANSNAAFIVGNGDSEIGRSTIFEVTSDGAYAADFKTSSDARLKTNISPIENALDKIMKIRGVTYNWDKSVAVNANASSALQYGVVAQEIEKIFPDLVSDGLNGYKAVNYNGIIPVLIQAVKEQQNEIDELKNTINQLIERLEKLENK